MKNEERFICDDCGEEKKVQHEGGTGYASLEEDGKEKTICYECCGKRDAKQLETDNKVTLYLTHDTFIHGTGTVAPMGSMRNGKVSNWPGTLTIPCRVRIGRHNMARFRYDVWFEFAGRKWHGVQVGDNTQLCHCRVIRG